MTIPIFALVSACLAGCLIAAPTDVSSSRKHSGPEKLQTGIWRVDLEAVSYAEKKSWREAKSVSPMFISQQVLAVAYRFSSEPTLWVKFFDTSTGRLRIEKHWDDSSRLLATRNGEFLVQGRSRLMLYSEKLELLKEVNIPSDKQGYSLFVSPGGHNLFLQYRRALRFILHKLDAHTLDDLEEWKAEAPFIPPYARSSLSDDKVAFIENENDPKSLFLRSLNRSWSPAAGTSITVRFDRQRQVIYSVTRGRVGVPTFIAQDLIVLFGGRAPVTLLNTDGKILLMETPVHGLQYAVDPVLPSADGNRFALRLATRWLNFSDFPDHHRYIGGIVYDVGQRKVIYRASQDPVGLEEWALSPDGSILANVHGALLDCVRLP